MKRVGFGEGSIGRGDAAAAAAVRDDMIAFFFFFFPSSF